MVEDIHKAKRVGCISHKHVMTVPVDKGQRQLTKGGGGYFPLRTARCAPDVHFNTPQKLNYLSNGCALQLCCYCNHWFNALHFCSLYVDVCSCTTVVLYAVNVDYKREFFTKSEVARHHLYRFKMTAKFLGSHR